MMRALGILGWIVAAGLTVFLLVEGQQKNPEESMDFAALAELHHQSGELDLAEAMYRVARLEHPDDASLDERLGYLLYEMERDKDAAKILALAKKKGAKVDWVDFTLKNIDAQVDMAGPFPRFLAKAPKKQKLDKKVPEKKAPTPLPVPEVEAELQEQGEQMDLQDLPSECMVKLRRSEASSAILIDLVINGEEATMILDSGATLSVLSGELAEVLNLDTSSLKPIIAKTANGKTKFATAMLDEVRFDERAVFDLRVAICDSCGTDLYDGLLGLDVQRLLGMVMWPQEDKVVFADCL